VLIHRLYDLISF